MFPDIIQHDHILYMLGSIGLIVEIALLGLSGPLLFISAAFLITGGLVSADVLSSWESEAVSVAVMSIFLAIVAWRPLKKLQGEGNAADKSSDLIGTKVVAKSEISRAQGTIAYSDTMMNAVLSKDCSVDKIEPGTIVEIVAVSGTTMTVREHR